MHVKLTRKKVLHQKRPVDYGKNVVTSLIHVPYLVLARCMPKGRASPTDLANVKRWLIHAGIAVPNPNVILPLLLRLYLSLKTKKNRKFTSKKGATLCIGASKAQPLIFLLKNNQLIQGEF